MLVEMIRNRARGTVIADDVEVAGNVFSKMIGLMFRSGIGESSGLLMDFGKRFQDRHSIWMLGMRFPIDVIFIDSEMRVTDVFHSVPPVSLSPRTWKVYKPSRPVRWILEVASGVSRKTKTKPGDQVSIKLG